MRADQLLAPHCRDVQRGLGLKAYPIGATALRLRRRSKRGWLLRAARALSQALHDSRTEAARKILHDYRHLIQECNASSSCDGAETRAPEGRPADLVADGRCASRRLL